MAGKGFMMAGKGRAEVTALGGCMVTALVLTLLGISYLLSSLVRLPPSFDLPPAVRLLGAVVSISGLAIAAWAISQRGFAAVVASTYVTLTKAIRRIPLAQMAGRTEALVVVGPQKYTRNPLYFGVVVMLLGLALLTASSFLFVATVVFLLWFCLILIPYEERELRALFGEEWTKYAEVTPMLIPFIKRRKRLANH